MRAGIEVVRDLRPRDLGAVRGLLDAAFAGDFDADDWAHGLGGRRVVARLGDGAVVAHAAVVERPIDVGARTFRAGYVEAVATAPAHQRTGIGTAVMRRVADVIRSGFELGVLGTGEWGFYERLGWERWRGPSWVRHPDGRTERTPDDDDGLMVLRFGPSSSIDLAAPISCRWRQGDVW